MKTEPFVFYLPRSAKMSCESAHQIQQHPFTQTEEQTQEDDGLQRGCYVMRMLEECITRRTFLLFYVTVK